MARGRAIVCLQKNLSNRDFRSFGGNGKRREKRKSREHRPRFRLRNVSFFFLWIRIEVPPIIIVAHRMHECLVLFCCSYSRREKPIANRHPVERQRLPADPRQVVVASVLRRQKRLVTRRRDISSVWNLFYLPQLSLPYAGQRRDAFPRYACTRIERARRRKGKEKSNEERKREQTLPRDPRRLIRRDSVYHILADPCLPDCSIFLHTYLNYWNSGITIFHWFIDASSRLFPPPPLYLYLLSSFFSFFLPSLSS